MRTIREKGSLIWSVSGIIVTEWNMAEQAHIWVTQIPEPLEKLFLNFIVPVFPNSNLHESGRNYHLNSTAMCRTSVKVSFKFTLLLGESSWDPILLHTMSCKMFCLKWKVSHHLSMTRSRQTKHCPTELEIHESLNPSFYSSMPANYFKACCVVSTNELYFTIMIAEDIPLSLPCSDLFLTN